MTKSSLFISALFSFPPSFRQRGLAFVFPIPGPQSTGPAGLAVGPVPEGIHGLLVTPPGEAGSGLPQSRPGLSVAPFSPYNQRLFVMATAAWTFLSPNKMLAAAEE